MKAKIVVFPRPMEAVIEEVEIPSLGDQDVLVEVEYSSISIGTERWCLTGRMAIPGQPALAFPHVPGYQAAGIVLEIGKQVRSLQPGDRVFSRNCRAPTGWAGSWWGGHAALHVAEENSVIKLPDSVSTYEASSLLLAQVGYNGASKPKVSLGDVAVVVGEGLVGQYAAQVLRNRGAHVVVSGLLDFRLELARQFSADGTFNDAKGELVDAIRRRYAKGVAITVETASSSRTVRLAIDLLQYGGQLVLNGYYPPAESCLDWHWLRNKELTVYCPNSRTRQRLEAALELIDRGVISVKELVTHDFPLSQSPEAYAKLLASNPDYLGMVIHWKER
jgi:bacteriochlorophyllide a dehydrogenase